MGQNDGISKHYEIIVFFPYPHSSGMITVWGKILTLRFMALD